MNFCALSPMTSTYKLIIFAVYSPFFAPALCGCTFITVESNDKFSISASAFNALKYLSVYHSSRHLQNLLYTVFHEPYLSGRSSNLLHFLLTKTFHLILIGHLFLVFPFLNVVSALLFFPTVHLLIHIFYCHLFHPILSYHILFYSSFFTFQKRPN